MAGQPQNMPGKYHLIGMSWFAWGFQNSSNDAAALISVGIVIAIEYQKFHLDGEFKIKAEEL